MANRADYRFEAGDRTTIVEVKHGVKTVAALRGMLLQVAYWLAEKPDSRGILLLVNPAISQRRLAREWALARDAIQPVLYRRLAIFAIRNESIEGWPQAPDTDTERILLRARQANEAPGGHRLPRPDYYMIILRILIHQWLEDAEPMTARWLGEVAGCSYPTVAGVLGKLGYVLTREKDRRFRLRRFPRNEWRSLSVNPTQALSTLRFRDASGQPRDPGALLKKANALERIDIAIGGVHAGNHYYPRINIVGAPRVDLCVHAPNTHVDLSFVRKLDPALELTNERSGPCHLAIHFVRSAESLFRRDHGLVWADPVECLLNLHEAGFATQAAELLNALSPGQNKVDE